MHVNSFVAFTVVFSVGGRVSTAAEGAEVESLVLCEGGSVLVTVLVGKVVDWLVERKGDDDATAVTAGETEEYREDKVGFSESKSSPKVGDEVVRCVVGCGVGGAESIEIGEGLGTSVGIIG